MMTLEEAIKHCKDVALSCTNKECALEHFQLLKWLQEYYYILKKQGKQKPTIIIPKFRVGDEIKTAKKAVNEESLTITKIDEKGYWSEDLFICSFEDSAKWELVGKSVDKVEPKFKVDDFKAKDWYVSKVDGKIHNIYYSADNIEPKFKVGDWVVLSTSDGEKVVQIDSIEYFKSGEPRYITSEGRWFGNGTKAHLWTIKDAKDGDVLFTSSTASHETFVFKSIDEKGNAKCYFAYDSEDGFREGKYHFIGRATDCKPATKEQRDILFQKIYEAGYKWDAEKKELKELKKIEQKQIVNIEIPYGAKDSELQEVSYHIPEGFHAEIEDNKVIIKKGEQNPTWSEEDENHIIGITQTINGAIKHNVISYKTGTMQIDWLKSLKGRVQPKQEWSEEDEKCIRLSTDIIDSALRAGLCVQLDRDRCVDWLKSLNPQSH